MDYLLAEMEHRGAVGSWPGEADRQHRVLPLGNTVHGP